MYTEKDLIGIAKRENNTKRNYLVVNRRQGKHVPVRPSDAFSMFSDLADLVKKAYPKETLLLIGFAETATAIGAALATLLDTYYMQTTREIIDGVSYFYFSESHSHATEQKLVKTDLDTILPKIDRIIFVEDEVTTGNTIFKIITQIKNTYSQKIAFSVASLLNGMNPDACKNYEENEIQTHYLLKTCHDKYSEIADTFLGNGIYHDINTTDFCEPISFLNAKGYQNARRLVCGKDYLSACHFLWEQIAENFEILPAKAPQKLLVIGTEEFMFPALYVGKKLEELGYDVKSHSTTRSPITVSSEPEYPLHERYSLSSLYDDARKTFLYDIGTYDGVFILTDAAVLPKQKGLNSLLHALFSCKNKKINLIRWCENE